MSQRALACPKCKTRLAVPEGVARFRCPKCKTVLAAPPAAAAPATAPSAPAVPPTITKPAMSPEAAQKLVGQDVAGYHIERLIGQGGMGSVFEALQAGLKRRVALKVLPSHYAQDPSFLAGFKREAQAVAKLNHPNIIQIFDIIEDEGYHFFSMEMVDGESLGDRMEREGPLPVSESLGIIAQVAAALDYAYEHMLIHRDLKPNNILLTKGGEVKVVDLGLSRSLEESPVGVVGGTHGGPVYMAPEFGQNPALADCRADIYALGCVLFHMITGRPPFPGPSAAELVSQHAGEPFPSARALNPKVASMVDALLAKMCAKDANERFQTHGELLERIGTLLSSTTVRMPKVVQANPVARRKRRKRRGMWPFGLLVLAAVITAAAFLGPPVFRSGEPEAENVSAGQVDTASPAATPAPDDGSGSDVVVVKADLEEGRGVPHVADLEPIEGHTAAVDWSAQFLAAKTTVAALTKQGKFADALAAMEALLAVAPEDKELKATVEDGTQAIRRQAAEQYATVQAAAREHVEAGAFDEARALLQRVVDTYGTPGEVGAARALLAELERREERHGALSSITREARGAAEAAGGRAAAWRLVTGSLDRAAGLATSWKLAEAAKALDGVQTGDADADALLTEQRVALEALLALQQRMSQAIAAARPPITKRDVAMVGLNGDLIAADGAGITTRTPAGDAKTAWGELREETARALAGRGVGPDPVEQSRGQALFLALLTREKPFDGEAVQTLARAESEAKAARAFADAVQLLEKGPNQQAARALATYAKAYGETRHFADHAESYKLATSLCPAQTGTSEAPTPAEPPGKPETPATPPPPKPEPAVTVSGEELALYQKAAAAFGARRYEEARTHLDALKAQFPQSALFGDAKRTPSVAAMEKAVAARGERIVLSMKAPGAVRALEAALAAVRKPNSTIEIEPGKYPGSGEASGRDYTGLIVRGAGADKSILDGGRRAHRILNLLVDCNDVWIEGLEFADARAGLYVGPRSSVTLTDCVALDGLQQGLEKSPGASLTVRGSALSADELSQVQASGSAVVLAAGGFVENSQLTACVVTGSGLSLDGVALSDCLVVGDVSVGSRTKLAHVTVVGTVTVPETAAGVSITDSIVESLQVEAPEIGAGEEHALAVTLDHVALIRPAPRRWAKGLVKEDKVAAPARVQFASRRAGDYRLVADSPYAAGARDGSALGCRFPEAMLQILKLAGRHPAILKPSSRRHGG